METAAAIKGFHVPTRSSAVTVTDDGESGTAIGAAVGFFTVSSVSDVSASVGAVLLLSSENSKLSPSSTEKVLFSVDAAAAAAEVGA